MSIKRNRLIWDLYFSSPLEQFHTITFKGYESITWSFVLLPKTKQKIISTVYSVNDENSQEFPGGISRLCWEKESCYLGHLGNLKERGKKKRNVIWIGSLVLENMNKLDELWSVKMEMLLKLFFYI